MIRLKGFRKLVSIDEARRTFLMAFKIQRPKIIHVSLDLALNHVLAEPITAEESLPRFNRSAVDGYAVKAENTVGASQFKPKTMSLTERKEIDRNQSRLVWTGNPIPRGADAVAMLENTRRINEKVEVWMPLVPRENVSMKGEDVRKGEVVVRAGTRLKPQHIGLMAALGVTQTSVFAKPKIAILAVGSEIVEVGSQRRKNQIFDVNTHVVSALCGELGAEPVVLGIAGDNVREISEKLTTGLAADAIITTGGTSVGTADLVTEVVNKIGKPGVLVHGIAMRPAMPTGLAAVNGKPILILSGNPVAAMIAFEVFARPLISKMLGLEQEETLPLLGAKMARRVNTSLGRRTFLRVNVSQNREEFVAQPISARGSGMISTMTRSNGYVIVPENREGLEAGETVLVHMFSNVEVINDVQRTTNA